MSGFASGALSSWAGHGASALGLTNTTAGKLAFSSITGGIGSLATGGDFLQGAASGLMVGLLNQVQHATLQKQLEAKLKSVKVGESISGKELAKLIGRSEISSTVNKITRVDETTFDVSRTLVGKGFINDTPAKIEKSTIQINNKIESAYRIQIGLKSPAIKAGLPPDFYIHNNRMYFYERGKLFYYDGTK